MNIFFRIGETVVTPPASGTILPGVTRDSILLVLGLWQSKLEVRSISVDELLKHHRSGALRECFVSGTAASVIPVACIGTEHERIELPALEADSYASRLGSELHEIRTGARKGPAGWVHPL